MALFENIADLKEFIPFNGQYNLDNLRPSIEDAKLEFIQPVCGELYATLASEATGSDAAIKNAARKELKRAIANYAAYLNVPFMSVLISNSGVNVTDNTNFKPATNAQLNDLRRSFLRTGGKSLDRLLKILELNVDVFPDWMADYLPLYEDGIVQNTQTFNKYFFIFDSRQTFIALRPTMTAVEDQYINSFLCDDFLHKMKTKTIDLNDSAKRIKVLLQKSVVAFTVSKVVTEGQFILDPKGIHLKFDLLPHESVGGGKDNLNFLNQTSIAKQSAGMEYLKQADTIIEANPNDFTECGGKIISEKESTGASWKPYAKNSIIGI